MFFKDEPTAIMPDGYLVYQCAYNATYSLIAREFKESVDDILRINSSKEPRKYSRLVSLCISIGVPDRLHHFPKSSKSDKQLALMYRRLRKGSYVRIRKERSPVITPIKELQADNFQDLCPSCEMSFASESALNGHMKSCNSQTDR